MLNFRIDRRIRETNTVEPRFHELPRDWGNCFVISRVRFIKVLFHTSHYYWAANSVKNNFRYTEDFVV